MNLQRIRSPQEFRIEDCERNPDHIVLGVLIESDGNSSHAVCIHGGFVYDANEATAIPLCEEAMNYCCSTPTVSNKFVAFKHVTKFYYSGKNPEIKRLMTIPKPDPRFGESKVSHVHQHPNLVATWSPMIHFQQLDGQDLCAAKSLASALYALGFEEEATRLNEHFEKPEERRKLAEMPLGNAVANVGRYARALLPSWIARTVVRTPQDFDWQNVQHYTWPEILMGILNSSDGSHHRVVTLHGGYVYDANEGQALRLSQEALDYCCSTETVKNTFVNFRKVVKFHYDGPDIKKRQQMILSLPGSVRPPPRQPWYVHHYSESDDSDSEDCGNRQRLYYRPLQRDWQPRQPREPQRMNHNPQDGGYFLVPPDWQPPKLRQPREEIHSDSDDGQPMPPRIHLPPAAAAAFVEEKVDESPPRKRGRGRPKKSVPILQFVHRDEKRKKRKRKR